MKTKRRFIVLIVAAVLLIGAGTGALIVSNAETGATADVGLRNVIYNEKMCFAVQLIPTGVAEGEELGLIFWNQDVDLDISELTVANASSASFQLCHDDKANVDYYCTAGIPADSIFDEVRFAACVRNVATGKIEIISDIVSYSVAEYVGSRVIAGDATEAQILLYQKIYDYAYAAMEVLKDGDFAPNLALVKTVGGTVGMHDYATLGGKLGATFSINAPEFNKDGEPFHGWECGGVIVSRERSYTLTLRTTGISTYTAIYGQTDIPDASEKVYDARVMSAKGGADGIVVLIHDDGTPATVAIMDRLYEQYGLVGDMALTQNNAEKYTSTWQDYLSTNRWKVVSHSKTHTWWGQYTESGGNSSYCDTETEVSSHPSKTDDADKLHIEVVGSQESLRNLFPGQRVLTFAYPGFSTEKKSVASNKAELIFSDIYSQASRDLIEQTYISARAAGLGYPLDIDDPEGSWAEKAYATYSSEDLWNYFPSYSIGKDITPATTAVDDAASIGGIAVIFCHKVVDAYTGGSNETLTADWELLCEKIAGYKNNGKIWSANYEDAILYLREATTSTLNVVEYGEGGMTVLLTDGMDDAIYDMSLTVRVNIPENWEAVKVVQGDKVSYAYGKFVGNAWIADTEIVPDRGEAYITPITAEQIEQENTYDLKAETYLDFNEGLDGAKLNNHVNGVLSATELDGRTVLNMHKTTEKNGRKLVLPLGETVTDADTIEVSFSIRIEEGAAGNALFRCFLHGTTITNSPIDAQIFKATNGFTLGWANANNSNKPLAYGEWHDVKLVVKVDNGDPKSVNAAWYADGEIHSTTTVGYTETDNTIDNTVDAFYMYDQSSSYFNMYLDSFYMRAYNGPDKKEPVEAAPELELDSTDSWRFEDGVENVKASNQRGSVTSAEVFGKNAVTLGKASGGGSQFTFPLAATVQPEVLKLSFDMYFHHTAADDVYFSSAKNVAFRIYQNSTYKNSSYSGSIHTYNNSTADDITDDYFTIGDASSSSSSTANYKSNSALGGHLSFNTWYNVELLIHVGDGTAADFYAVWYVNGEFYGYSTNFYNEDGSIADPTDTINLTSDSMYIYALSASKFNVSFDNVTVDAYNDALKVEPDVVKTWDFEDAENLGVSIDTGDKTNNTFSATEKDDRNALHINKQATGTNAKYIMTLGQTYEAKKAVIEFNIFISRENTSKSSGGTHLAYIFFRDHKGYTTSPYGAMIHSYDDGFTFGDNVVTPSNITKALGDRISYDVWHSVKLEVVTGDKDTFLATWYVDGELYATSTKFIGGGEASFTTVDSACIWVQGTPTMNAYIDDLTLEVYEK